MKIIFSVFVFLFPQFVLGQATFDHNNNQYYLVKPECDYFKPEDFNPDYVWDPTLEAPGSDTHNRECFQPNEIDPARFDYEWIGFHRRYIGPGIEGPRYWIQQTVSIGAERNQFGGFVNPSSIDYAEFYVGDDVLAHSGKIWGLRKYRRNIGLQEIEYFCFQNYDNSDPVNGFFSFIGGDFVDYGSTKKNCDDDQPNLCSYDAIDAVVYRDIGSGSTDTSFKIMTSWVKTYRSASPQDAATDHLNNQPSKGFYRNRCEEEALRLFNSSAISGFVGQCRDVWRHTRVDQNGNDYELNCRFPEPN